MWIAVRCTAAGHTPVDRRLDWLDVPGFTSDAVDAETVAATRRLLHDGVACISYRASLRMVRASQHCRRRRRRRRPRPHTRAIWEPLLTAPLCLSMTDLVCQV